MKDLICLIICIGIFDGEKEREQKRIRLESTPFFLVDENEYLLALPSQDLLFSEVGESSYSRLAHCIVSVSDLKQKLERELDFLYYLQYQGYLVW